MLTPPPVALANSVESALQKAADLSSTMPAGVASAASLQSVQFADGVAARLRVAVIAELRLSPDQFRAVTQMLPR